MQDLTVEEAEYLDKAANENDASKAAGCQMADNEAAYRIALRVEILKEREKGTPVTIIGDLCRGKPEIAELKRLRDTSEVIYKASCEAVNVNKLRARIVDAQIERDWHSS